MDEKYMNGVGVMQKTRELNDKMWDALLPAFFGMSTASCGPLLSWAIFIHRMPWDEPASTTSIVLGILIASTSFVAGVWVSIPWFRAVSSVKKHIKEMEAETAKRGKGWASS